MEEIKNLIKNIVLKAVEKPDEILLYNRYHEDVRLKKVNDNTYELIIPKTKDGESWERWSYDEKDGVETIYMVDPSGGPFMSIGECQLPVYGGSSYFTDLKKITRIIRNKQSMLWIISQFLSLFLIKTLLLFSPTSLL